MNRERKCYYLKGAKILNDGTVVRQKQENHRHVLYLKLVYDKKQCPLNVEIAD